MHLPDNIIKHYLRNVYFLSGSACGGKSTIARYLAATYDLTLYDLDERIPRHKALSDLQHQPVMHATYASWDAYFNRPPEVYAESLRRSTEEQAEIAVVELLTLAEGRTIVVDGYFPCAMLQRSSTPDRVVILMADIHAIRSDYLNRADKADNRACLAGLEDPERSTEAMFLALEHGLARDMEEVRASGFTTFVRGPDTDWDRIREGVAHHFGFAGP